MSHNYSDKYWTTYGIQVTHTQLAYKTFPRLCSLKAENLSSLLCIGLASCRAIGPVSVGDWWFSHSFLATNFPTSCVTKLSFSNRNRVGVTAWSSWLPNQMISLIWIFGFLFRYPDDLRNIVQQCANGWPAVEQTPIAETSIAPWARVRPRSFAMEGT